jgi:deferrochelatase/peroxidase EfeB
MIARLTQGKPLDKGDPDPKFPPVDTGEDAGLQTARLTVTVGFGASLFEKDGADRFGFRSKKPLGLTEMPKFHGDSLQEMWTHGDIVVQACADDPIVCFHAIRNLAKASRGVAHLRWQQSGQWGMQKEGTRRNLFGFKDGTNNPDVNDEAFMKRNIWIAPEDGQAWLAGGTYMVVRRINMRIETWDQLTFKEQEETIGRKKASGSPMDGQNEFDAPNYAADPDGKKTPLDSHVRLSNPRTGEASERERILRRGFNFMEPLDAVGRINAGLLFICFNRSIQNQFASIQQRLSNPRHPDKLLSYTQTNGGGYFVVPPGVQRQGQFLGEGLFL